VSGIEKIVSRAEGGPWFTKNQVAKLLERHPDTIDRWQKEGKVLRPTHRMPLGDEGESFVWLYSEDDVRAYQAYASSINPSGGREKRAETV
jgi:hypothetical protein